MNINKDVINVDAPIAFVKYPTGALKLTTSLNGTSANNIKKYSQKTVVENNVKAIQLILR